MPPMTPTSGTPYTIIMPVKVANIAIAPEAVMPTSPSVPFIMFGAGGQRYRYQSCNGQCLDNKSSFGVHDRSFQSD
jgi:hypothetical protein